MRGVIDSKSGLIGTAWAHEVSLETGKCAQMIYVDCYFLVDTLYGGLGVKPPVATERSVSTSFPSLKAKHFKAQGQPLVLG